MERSFVGMVWNDQGRHTISIQVFYLPDTADVGSYNV